MEPLLSLALSVQSNPKGYAFLLGSGISSSAGVPTGWDVVLELIRRLAIAECEDPGADPPEWFRQKYGTEPRYDSLVSSIARSLNDRRALLRTFFEPTNEERDRGEKMPSDAHRSIAKLVAGGFVRVIVTTNFDRLTEQALDEEGIRPNVIDTADSISGAPGLSSGEVFVVKVHGDYLDTRIRNTPEELGEYQPEMAAYLTRIISEFGIVVCGWSGEWDVALRELLSNSPPRSTGTYWVSRREPAGESANIIHALGATVIRTRDADAFAKDLADRVLALEEMTRGRPLGAAVAIANAKRYLVDTANRIRLRDLVLEEADRLVQETRRELFPVQPGLDENGVLERMKAYEALSEAMAGIIGVGCFYGLGVHDSLWVECLEKVAALRGEGGGNSVLLSLELYPALLMIYSAGSSCIAAGQYGTLEAVLTRAKALERGRETEAIKVLRCPLGDGINWSFLPERGREWTPLNNLLFDSMKNLVREVFRDDRRYEEAFDRYEYLSALVHYDLERQANPEGHVWAPIGRFGWRNRRYRIPTVIDWVRQDIETEGASWGPLRAGLFGGSLERATEVKRLFDEWVARATQGWGF
jgi:hypothetical protein